MATTLMGKKREMAERIAAAQRGAQEHLGNYKGTIEYKDLKGKIVEWSHHTGAIRLGRVVAVRPNLIEITDAADCNHKATMKQIIGAWSKRGSKKYLRVITTKQEKKKETRKK
jgi:hypothetical protein